MPFRNRYTGLIDNYRDRLPVHDDTRIISLGEGNTPLIRLHNIPDELGKDVESICIGESGEKLALISCIITDRGAAAGRSGLGAVMGSKKLKALAVKAIKKCRWQTKRKPIR